MRQFSKYYIYIWVRTWNTYHYYPTALYMTPLKITSYAPSLPPRLIRRLAHAPNDFSCNCNCRFFGAQQEESSLKMFTSNDHRAVDMSIFVCPLNFHVVIKKGLNNEKLQFECWFHSDSYVFILKILFWINGQAFLLFLMNPFVRLLVGPSVCHNSMRGQSYTSCRN